MNKGPSKEEKKQESREMETRCWAYLRPFLDELHKRLDRRLVKTLLDLVMVILMHRHRNNGLLLSELGEHILGGERGPAGVKRIASLLHSAEKVKELLGDQSRVYVIWDESVLEKSESLKAEGLCAVRSTKAARMGQEGDSRLGSRLCRQSLDNPCSGSPPTLYPAVEQSVSCPWTQWTQTRGLEGCTGQAFIPKDIGTTWEYRMIWDARRRCYRKTGILAALIHLPDDDHQLFLVASRPGYGRKPWYLITTEPVYNSEQAWQIVFAYARRWQIEMSLRFTKSEMAFESPRLQAWESRLKFLLIASLAYAFLLSLLANMEFLFWFISRYCHRTGKWSRDISAPLYRLRLALSRLWLLFRPHSLPSLDSG